MALPSNSDVFAYGNGVDSTQDNQNSEKHTETWNSSLKETGHIPDGRKWCLAP